MALEAERFRHEGRACRVCLCSLAHAAPASPRHVPHTSLQRPACPFPAHHACGPSLGRAPVFRELYSEKTVIEEERRLRVNSAPLGR